jgi:hypothetical protein
MIYSGFMTLWLLLAVLVSLGLTGLLVRTPFQGLVCLGFVSVLLLFLVFNAFYAPGAIVWALLAMACGLVWLGVLAITTVRAISSKSQPGSGGIPNDDTPEA